jgi:hypothetical protein
MSRITNSAAMLVRDNGIAIYMKKRHGPAPSSLAASASSSGIVGKRAA